MCVCVYAHVHVYFENFLLYHITFTNLPFYRIRYVGEERERDTIEKENNTRQTGILIFI